MKHRSGKIKIADKMIRMDKFQRQNAGKTLTIGDKVENPAGSIGTVVEIVPHNPQNPIADHGAIKIQIEELRDGDPHDGSGFETCVEFNWERFLLIISPGEE